MEVKELVLNKTRSYKQCMFVIKKERILLRISIKFFKAELLIFYF